jgi:hypothetical protein
MGAAGACAARTSYGGQGRSLGSYDGQVFAPAVSSGRAVDNLLGYGTPPAPVILSGLKARRFGFNDCIDSEEMFLDWLRLLQADRIFPGPQLDEQFPTGETAIIKL